MLKIRLMRIGTKKRPFYRVVVVDERAKRTGAYLELLGTYNPLTEPKDIKLVQDRIDHWIKQGAQMSEGFLRIIGKAPQRPPRKPKKIREQVKTEEPVKEEAVEEAPKLSEVETGSAEASADRDSADLQSEAILKIKESDQASQPEVEEKKDEGST